MNENAARGSVRFLLLVVIVCLFVFFVAGHIRVAFANLPLETCKEAAARLERGLHQLVTDGNV